MHEAPRNSSAPIACLGAGTGLGECFLTPDGDGECHVLFTKHGGTIISVEDLHRPYTVTKTEAVKGAGDLTTFDRTGNTYGMEAWVCVGQSDKAPVGFARPVAAPWATVHKSARDHG